MVGKNGKVRTVGESSEPTSFDKDFYVAKWQLMLREAEDEKRALNVHAIMCEVNQLKKEHAESSVLAAFQVVYPDPATRTRLQRLHEVPLATLESAMRRFRIAKRRDKGVPRSKKTLTTSHLEALSRCIDAKQRLRFLRDCASGGWTATRLREEIAKQSSDPRIRPLVLTKQIRQQAQALLGTLNRIERESIVAAIGTVKARDWSSAYDELQDAVNDLEALSQQMIEKKLLIVSAIEEMDRLSEFDTTQTV